MLKLGLEDETLNTEVLINKDDLLQMLRLLKSVVC